MTINSMSLISAGGGSVAVMSTPRPMEMMRPMGTVAPPAMAGVPQGTYTGMTMTFGASTVTYVDPTTGLPVQRTVPGPMTTTVTFGSPLVVGATPMVVNLDMNMAASVAIDAMGNVSMTPSLREFHNPAVTGSADPEDGGMHGLTGMVGTVGGTSFTFTMTQGMSGLSMTTGAGTQYTGMSGIGMTGGGLLMSVDATLLPDGSWMANRVQLRMAAGGAMAAGVVTSLTGTPPTQLVLVMHDGSGNGMMATNLFSAVQMTQGGGTLAATSIIVGQQGLRGTVSAYAQSASQSSFKLTLPADSAFAKLTGATTVTVYQQAGTKLRGVSNITNGGVVQVRGLVFQDAGLFKVVAGRILGA